MNTADEIRAAFLKQYEEYCAKLGLDPEDGKLDLDFLDIAELSNTVFKPKKDADE